MRARNALCIAAAVAATSGLTACGSHHDKAIAHDPSVSAVPSVAAKPIVVDVRAASGTYNLVVGQHLTLKVNNVKVTPGKMSCAQAKTSTAIVRPLCTSGPNYDYQAAKPGKTQMEYSVKPLCKAGTMCPAWIQQAAFVIVVKSA